MRVYHKGLFSVSVVNISEDNWHVKYKCKHPREEMVKEEMETLLHSPWKPKASSQYIHWQITSRIDA